MLRTTLLIVLVMAGSPIDSLACELWCNGPAGADHHRVVGCHDASQAGPRGPQIAHDGASCHDAADMASLVAEVRRAESAPAVTAVATLVDTGALAPAADEMSGGGCVFDARTSRRPAPRAILRV